MERKTCEQGITLIALVVTIVVLLILAGVSINLVLGNNGIIIKSVESRVANDHATVLERLQLDVTGNAIEFLMNADTLSFLRNNGYINDDNTVNLGKLNVSTKTGKGTLDSGDVYIVEKKDNDLILIYKDEENNSKELGKIGEIGEIQIEDDFWTPNGVNEDYLEEAGTVLGDYKGDNIFDEVPAYRCKYTELNIPQNINLNKIQPIINVTKVNGYVNTGYAMFREWKELKDADIYILDKTASTTEMFRNCVNLENVRIENLETTNADAFKNCNALKTVRLKNVQKIGERTFWNLENLQSVRLENVKELGNYAFAYCNNLQTVRLENVKELGNSTFYDCGDLQTVYIEGEITDIGKDCFRACNKLKSIALPDSITNIDKYAFYNDNNLETIYTDSEYVKSYVNSNLSGVTIKPYAEAPEV